MHETGQLLKSVVGTVLGAFANAEHGLTDDHKGVTPYAGIAQRVFPTPLRLEQWREPAGPRPRQRTTSRKAATMARRREELGTVGLPHDLSGAVDDDDRGAHRAALLERAVHGRHATVVRQQREGEALDAGGQLLHLVRRAAADTQELTTQAPEGAGRRAQLGEELLYARCLDGDEHQDRTSRRGTA